MAKKITFRFTGEAERFFEYMEEQGVNAQDVVSKALWLFEIAWKTQRLVLLNEESQLEYIFTQQPLAGVAKFARHMNKSDEEIRALFEKPVVKEKRTTEEGTTEGEGR